MMSDKTEARGGGVGAGLIPPSSLFQFFFLYICWFVCLFFPDTDKL